VLMLFWFAPPLAAWHSTGALKALFFSFVACLMNWRAFLAYGAAVAVMMMAVPLATLLALRAFAGAGLGVAVASLVFPLLLLMLPTLFASFYVSYRDVFGVEKR
ncbi:MAG: BPSS1780 family membrane protein, partial [Burkholderiales bacterium]